MVFFAFSVFTATDWRAGQCKDNSSYS